MKSLDISCCKNLTESDINSFLCKQSYLTSFSFREGALSDLSLEMLCDNFKQLRSVNLAGVESITGSGLINLAKHLCHLDFIDLSRASCSSKNYVITCMHLSTKLKVITFNFPSWTMGARWTEFDERLWTVNDHRMKNAKRAHSGRERTVNDMSTLCERKINDLCEVPRELSLHCISSVIRKNSKSTTCNVVLSWKLIQESYPI